MKRSALYLWCEFLVLFGGVPLLILNTHHRGLMIGLLWGGAAAVYIYMRRHHAFRHRGALNLKGLRQGLRGVLFRFLIATPFLIACAWLLSPSTFFAFPRERPDTWLRVMLLYPLLSVWPQELIYRSFLRRRYERIFRGRHAYAVISALAFGYMHIIFANVVAVVLTMAGGYLFARTYEKHKSLALVCLEHALYGCLVFTIGLGIYFYSGRWHTPS